MNPGNPSERSNPERGRALLFLIKSRLLRLRRHLAELGDRPPKHPISDLARGLPLVAEVRAPLWSMTSPEEFPLTAGKVENLRQAARRLDGTEVPAGETFSFWRQLGRTTRSRGFTTGRELREGCLIPSIGGGLCQISGLIYRAALEAGLEIVERHAHSRIVPGSSGELDLDATVFWNYVDLRLRAPAHWRMEVRLEPGDLVVGIRTSGIAKTEPLPLASPGPVRAGVTGDCLTCHQTSCFRHPSATAAHAPGLGHAAFLLDTRWPEFDRWCTGHSREGDRWFLPLDGLRLGKPNYAWSPPEHIRRIFATAVTLRRSLVQRRLPPQGAVRQRTLLRADETLAKYYAKRISPECRHLVVSMNLLPHLRRLGALGGRTHDVLVDRWPMAEIHRLLDRARSAHPDSPTLGDFRAPDDLLRDETEALASAARLITPHRAIAALSGNRALRLDWDIPGEAPRPERPGGRLRLFLPCSPLGRKGVHELAAALRSVDAELLVLGKAREDPSHSPLDGIDWRGATLAELPSCDALILPAWIENQPRLALRALAMGVPVIATKVCGLSDHPLLHQVEEPDPAEITAAILEIASPAFHPHVLV